MAYTPSKITRGFITNTVTGETLKYQYNPDVLDTEKEGQWEDTDARNTHPHQDWKGGGNHKINFPLTFIYKGDYDTSAAVVWLRTLTEPIWRNKKLVEPPVCLVRIGGGTWKVKVRKVHVSYRGWLPSGRPKYMVVNLECVEWKSVPKPPEETKKSTGNKSVAKKSESKPYAYLLDQ